jgi:holo-[acyl-carrier protein] synthase
VPPDGRRVTVGVDLVPVERMAQLAARGESLVDRVFTATEFAHCRARRQSDECLAARFAAKEAVLKAFGEGLAGGFRFGEIEVVPGDGGSPGVRLHGALAALAEERELEDIDLSLSHAGGMAVAVAVAVWRGQSASQT